MTLNELKKMDDCYCFCVTRVQLIQWLFNSTPASKTCIKQGSSLWPTICNSISILALSLCKYIFRSLTVGRIMKLNGGAFSHSIARIKNKNKIKIISVSLKPVFLAETCLYTERKIKMFTSTKIHIFRWDSKMII